MERGKRPVVTEKRAGRLKDVSVYSTTNSEEAAGSTSTRIARNAGVIMVARGIYIVVRLLTIKLFATYLGKEGFGVYSYVVALGEIFAVLSDFGLIRVGVREISRDRERAAEQFSNILALKGVLALVTVAVVLGLGLGTGMEPSVRSAVLIYTLAVILNYYANAFSVFYRAFERMEFEAALIIVERVLYLVFAILAVVWGLGLYGIFVGNLLSSVVKLAIAPVITHLKLVKLKFRLTAASFMHYFRESLPIGISMFLASVYLRVDVIILEHLRSSAEAGAFSGAYRIVDATMVLPTILLSALFPVLSRRAVAATSEFHGFLSKSFRVLLLMALPIAVLLFAWSEPLVGWILDKSFVESVYSLRLLAIVLVLSYPSFLFNQVMTAVGRQTIYTIGLAFSLAMNIVVDLLLVPSLGYLGACLSTIIAEVFVFVMSLYFLKRYADYSLRPSYLWKPVFAAALMAGVAYIGSAWSNLLGLVLLFAAAVAVYAGALVLTGGVSLDEILTVKRILSDLGRQGFRPAPGRRPGT
jgi:O-antigen/teichoic acid export membrane protein